MSNNNVQKLRDSLSAEDIKSILNKYHVSPHYENDNYIIYPTCCHNAFGGSHKLYYYKENKMFKCYTECGSVFDIFELIQKIQELRNAPVSLPQAFSIAGVNQNTNEKRFETPEYVPITDDMERLHSLNHANAAEEYVPEIYNEEAIMRNYIYSNSMLMPWIEEGINPQTLQKYKIKYDTTNNAIVIPHYNDEGGLIGVRGRFLDPDAPAKYKPVAFNGKLLRHRTSKVLYGLNFNKEAIQKHKIAIIFEGR